MSVTVISTITSAAASYNLVDLALVKAELGIKVSDTTNDLVLNQKIAMASTAIANYCNRVFVQEQVQDLIYPDQDTEILWSLGSFQPLSLSRFPVVSVESVTIAPDANPTDNLTFVQGTDFVLNQKAGQLIRISKCTGFPQLWQSYPITVLFTAGYTDIPGDIQQAALEMITGFFNRRGRDPNVKRTNQMAGVGEVEYWIPNNPQGAFTPSMTDFLDNYRPLTIAL